VSRASQKHGISAKSRPQNKYAAQNCPQIKKGESRPFLTIFGAAMRAILGGYFPES